MYSAIFEEWEIDEFWYFLCFPIKNKVLINFSSLRIYVEDTGPGKKLCRFIISECQEDDSMETVEILERAKELAIQVTFEGKYFTFVYEETKNFREIILLMAKDFCSLPIIFMHHVILTKNFSFTNNYLTLQ
jgi:hypothetical protein